MTRIRTRDVRPSQRPEPLGRPVGIGHSSLPVVPASGHKADHGYGPAAYDASAYPLTIGAHDAAILRREEAFRTRELADLPDEYLVAEE